MIFIQGLYSFCILYFLHKRFRQFQIRWARNRLPLPLRPLFLPFLTLYLTVVDFQLLTAVCFEFNQGRHNHHRVDYPVKRAIFPGFELEEKQQQFRSLEIIIFNPYHHGKLQNLLERRLLLNTCEFV